MANIIQRAIYNLANAVPLAIMMALAWYLEFNTWYIPVILITTVIVVTGLFIISFNYGKNNCSIKNINVSKIIVKDSWLVAYVIAYFFPFTYMIIADFHIVSLIIAALMLILVILPAIMSLPNILLYLVGYHFYELETESTGVGDYLLISKRRRIRNKADVKMVMRIFERLLLDTKEDK